MSGTPKRICANCAHYRQDGGWDWGYCHAPLPRWAPPAKPLLIANPQDRALAGSCPAYCLLVPAKVRPSPDLVDRILEVRRFKGRTADAAKLVLTQGATRAEACRQAGVDQAALTRMLQKLANVITCPGCGRPTHAALKPFL